MSDFDSYDCANCGKSFRALPGANAAENSYCSPRCEIEGSGLD
jgi:DNA-directed RNA polymerase subunit RPC12/RpoP